MSTPPTEMPDENEDKMATELNTTNSSDAFFVATPDKLTVKNTNQAREDEREEEKEEVPKLRDIRRYYCEHCGICRSKKSLIVAHIISTHKEEMDAKEQLGDEEEEKDKSNTCNECGACFKKPAYLKQHMQSHSLEE